MVHAVATATGSDYPYTQYITARTFQDREIVNAVNFTNTIAYRLTLRTAYRLLIKAVFYEMEHHYFRGWRSFIITHIHVIITCRSPIGNVPRKIPYVKRFKFNVSLTGSVSVLGQHKKRERRPAPQSREKYLLLEWAISHSPDTAFHLKPETGGIIP
jgi:hypothetical protein